MTLNYNKSGDTSLSRRDFMTFGLYATSAIFFGTSVYYNEHRSLYSRRGIISENDGENNPQNNETARNLLFSGLATAGLGFLLGMYETRRECFKYEQEKRGS